MPVQDAFGDHAQLGDDDDVATDRDDFDELLHDLRSRKRRT